MCSRVYCVGKGICGDVLLWCHIVMALSAVARYAGVLSRCRVAAFSSSSAASPPPSTANAMLAAQKVREGTAPTSHIAPTVKSPPVLTDKFGRKHTYLRLSMTEKCNLRCLYCMPEDGVPLQPQMHLLSGDELVEIAETFIEQGIDKIRLTGGEPLISPHVMQVCTALGAMPQIELLGITTNGLLLPRKFPALLDAGVNRINISLDTLVKEKFEFLTRRRGFHRVMESIDMALDAQAEQQQEGWINPGSSAPRDPFQVKMNVVMMKGVNEDEIADFVEFTRDRPINIRFIEFMPFNDNKWNENKFLSYKEALGMICADPRFQDDVGNPQVYALKNHFNDTSKGYKVKGFAGQIGFISSMTENFCTGCNRIRVCADGDLKVCLFGDEKDNVSLRDVVRRPGAKDERRRALLDTIRTQLQGKHRTLGGNTNMFELNKKSGGNRSMIRIGGFSTLARQLSGLTHVAEDADTGEKLPRMVDVSGKVETVRVAKASATVSMPVGVVKHIEAGTGPKGAVFATAIVAGTMGAKKTSELIPFCHPLNIDKCKVVIKVGEETVEGRADIHISCTVQCTGKTGIEMEALTGCSVAALAIYDMTKAMSHDIVIGNIHLVQKTGGKSAYVKDESGV